MSHGKTIRRLIGLSLILLAAAVAVAPQLGRGNSCGHDFDFHLISWFDCLHSWRQGILYPHWAPSANFSAGEPRFVFYPPLSWMLGAALGAVLPWPLVPITLSFLLLAGTGFATRALARLLLDEAPATLAGCAAIFSGYALFTAYERTAFGELAGGIWIPLLLLFLLRGGQKGSLWRRAFDGSAAPLAVVVAACWLSNAPVGVMACYLLAAVAVVSALLARSWIPVLRAAVSTALGLALCAFYLIPAASEQRWADIQKAASDPGEWIENSWLFARHADPKLAFHDIVLHTVSLVAVGMLAVAVVSLLILWLRGRLNRRWIPLALIPFAVLFLLLPVSLPTWNLLPKLLFLQFPWRWLVALEAPMALLFAAAVWPSVSPRRWLQIAVATLSVGIFLAMTWTAQRSFYQLCEEQDNVAAMLATYRAGTGFVGADEYEPPLTDETLAASGLPAACLTAAPRIPLGIGSPNELPVWTAAQGSCSATVAAFQGNAEHLHLQANLPHTGFLVLRLRAYPAWRLTLNGQSISALLRRNDGLIALPIPQGPVDLAIDWTNPDDVLLGRCLSALALLVLLALVIWERKLKAAHPTGSDLVYHESNAS